MTEKQQHISLIMSRLYTRILLIMDEQKPYLDPSLNLRKLVRIIGTNRTLLSSTLNCKAGMNFNRWLSIYRVNHLIEQIRANPGKNIEELYVSSGFASRTSFYRQFREVTGLTPKEFLLQVI